MGFKVGDRVRFVGPIQCIWPEDTDKYKPFLGRVFTLCNLLRTDNEYGEVWTVEKEEFQPFECELELAEKQLMLFEID